MPGYTVFFESAKFAMGGTSAVAPTWAALVARLNQRLGHPIGFFAPLLYGTADGCAREVTAGSNDRYQAATDGIPVPDLAYRSAARSSGPSGDS